MNSALYQQEKFHQQLFHKQAYPLLSTDTLLNSLCFGDHGTTIICPGTTFLHHETRIQNFTNFTFKFCKYLHIAFNGSYPTSYKKVCGPKKEIVKKYMKSKVVAKKWL